MTKIGSAMILAAGRGERMMPLTADIPKPLVELAGKPLIEWQIDMLLSAGIGKIVVNTSYMADKLEEYLARVSCGGGGSGDGGVAATISISHEDRRLETGGGMMKALPLLGSEAFVSVNSDAILVDSGKVPAMRRLCDGWNGDAMDILLLLQPVSRSYGYSGAGDFIIDDDTGRLRRVSSLGGDSGKAGCMEEDESVRYVFTGAQVVHPRVFERVSHRYRVGDSFSMNEIYNLEMDDIGRLGLRVSYVIHDGDWLHVGDVESLRLAERYVAKHSIRLNRYAR